MFRRQFIVTGIASSVLASAKLYGAVHGQAANATPQAPAANTNVPPDWVNPFPPHRVMNNLHYVGSEGLASYLVTTPDGNILINSSLEQSVPLIQASIEKLGFKFSDTKILLISHAHSDHCAGSAKIIQMTGAKYMVMTEDVPVVESGGKKDFQYGKDPGNWYPPAKVDRSLKGAESVRLGGSVLIGHKTAGHTKGCTTWTMEMKDEKSGTVCDAVIVGSPNVNPGYKLVNNAEFPTIAWEYEHAFAVWNQFPWPNIVFLGAHGGYYDMKTKYAKLNNGGENPFIDTAGYKAYIAEREAAFKEELKKQQAAAKK
ncbi:MAG TPA: subclass B3 metallo-beta-lactamase [Candidatus Acidoferrum sp.]|jgi:metallo-beta-lactamase class B